MIPQSQPSLPSWLQLLLPQGWMLHGHPSLDNERQGASIGFMGRSRKGQLCNTAILPSLGLVLPAVEQGSYLLGLF